MPALNEEKSIGKTIERIPLDILRKRGYSVELIVVDGDSIDRTREIAIKKGAKVIIEKRKGYGRAYMRGFKKAVGEIIVTTDADLTYPVEKIPLFIEYLIKSNSDFITTNRFWRYEKNAWTPINFIGNKILTLLVNFFFRMNLKDSQSGMWIFYKRVLDKISLKEEHMAFSTEIKVETRLRGFKIIELPITYRRRYVGTQSKLSWFKHGLEILRFIVKKRITSLW